MQSNYKKPNLFNVNHTLQVDEFDFWVIQELSVRESPKLEDALKTAARMFGNQATDILCKKNWIKPDCKI